MSKTKPKKKTIRELLEEAWAKFQGKKPGMAQKAADEIKTRRDKIEDAIDEASGVSKEEY